MLSHRVSTATIGCVDVAVHEHQACGLYKFPISINLELVQYV